MKRILYVSHTPERKGSAVSLHQLMRGLDRSRFAPVAAFSKPGPLVDALKTDGVPAHVLRRRGPLGLGLIREALTLIRSERIALVHLNSAVPFCRYVGIAAKLARVPVVWHVREDPRGKRVRRLKKWIRLLADRIFVVSSDLEAAFAPSPKVRKIFNGVDTTEFSPDVEGGEFRARFRIPADALVFGMVGSIEPRKGQLDFLRAASLLPLADDNVCLAIVGSGKADDERSVADYLAGNPAVAARTVCTGRLQDVSGAIAALDVLAIPSYWEGFPRALIEAMAAGKPAIASDVGEMPHIVRDGVTGWLVPCGDIERLADAMRGCLAERTRLAAMGNQARARAVAEFSLGAHVATVQGQYDELLRGR